MPPVQLTQNPPLTSSVHSSGSPYPSREKHILVVEDEPMVAETLRLVLELQRHKVDLASSGAEALALFKAADYDLVLTDLSMPAMDGLQLAQSIKRLSPVCPVILITAHADTLGASLGKFSKVDLVLGKPLTMTTLLNIIQHFKVRSQPAVQDH